jgi:hypothetical protein
MRSVLRRGLCLVAGACAATTFAAGPLGASSEEWAAAWCSASNDFADAYDEADDLGNELYGAARSGGSGLAALKRRLAAAASAARRVAIDAVDDLESAGVPDGASGAELQDDARTALETAAGALKKAGTKLKGFDPSDPEGTLKALRSAGSLGAAGKAEDAIDDFADELDDARATDPALDQALTDAGCAR